MKGNALAALFSIFLLNLLSTNSVVGGQGGPEATPFEITPGVYQKHAQQAAPEPRPAPTPPVPPATSNEGHVGQGGRESRPPVAGQANPEPRPPEKKKHDPEKK
jgi:hypothetical protein